MTPTAEIVRDGIAGLSVGRSSPNKVFRLLHVLRQPDASRRSRSAASRLDIRKELASC